MLEDLYNQFDAFCGQLDVYKVRLNTKLFSDFRLPRDINEICALSGYYVARVVIPYRRFGTTHRSYLRELINPRRMKKYAAFCPRRSQICKHLLFGLS
jgi:hypothetical protein